jgi:hypothetical protein
LETKGTQRERERGIERESYLVKDNPEIKKVCLSNVVGQISK